MTLTIHKTEDEQRQLKVTVEVAEERVEKQMQATARELSRGMQIPGFRKGKVPYQVLVQRLGYDALRAEAVDALLDGVYGEMLEQIDETPAAQPSLNNVQMDPLVLDFIIPLEPKIELGDYRSIRREVETVEVTEEAVDEALEHIREHHEVVEPVARPVMEGDLVTLGGTGEVVEGDTVEVIFDEERTDLLANPERTFPGTEFVANLIGLEVGDDAEFTITFPEEAPYLPEDDSEEATGASLAGKQAQFTVTILDVKSRFLPPLDDELARSEGDYETLAEMREAVRKNLEEQARQETRNKLFDEVMEETIAGSEIVFPPALVEQELDRAIESMKSQVTRVGWRWEDYLRLQNNTEEALREASREDAEARVRRMLVLGQLIEREYLSVNRQEVDDSIEERLAAVSGDEQTQVQQQLRDYFQKGEGWSMLSSELLMNKLYDRIEAIVTGNAPDLAELEAAAAAAELEEEE